MGGTLALVVSILVGSKLLKQCLLGSRAKPLAAGHFTPHLQRLQSRVKVFRGMCYGSVSGILSAHSLLLAKSAVELTVRTVIDGSNQFNRWQSWVILLTMIVLALTQLFYLHRGLKLCSTSVLYPFVFCVYNIIAILDGLIYFRQTSQLTKLHAGLIALGTVVLLGGVLCLSWRLEDVDSHAPVTVGGPTQTGLGPGMAVVEEHSPPSTRLLDGLADEESQLGEREPLLHGATGSHRLTHPRARAPSLPFIPSVDNREAADLNAASIWAELDDSDNDYVESHKCRSAERPRSSNSSTALHDPGRRLTRHSTIGPISYNRPRGPHRSRPPVQTSTWRRSSAPLAGLLNTQRKRWSAWGAGSSSSDAHWVGGYGTIQEDADNGDRRDEASHLDGWASGLLAGSRRSLVGLWRHGRQLFARQTGPQAGSQIDSNIDHDGSSSPLLPRSDVHFP